ncbi:hypothetical protein IQ37_15170 [Chryseobacterium piperi]|uniref:Sialate O-acetylesterase domain-containing protein n=1 Tax=Chryseobacterium piperi TaxID=558152 RepID=A0A086AXG4_9FLAO|nr:sialate O-acetylesterase [Chryseobacterium piperi]ASW74695.1 hypothetical protein CJF12_10635 [Chryseobacterium piperi]KFF21378.1 hypothetical protein IQ37_15170 [Chryseobacterium piperi]
MTIQDILALIGIKLPDNRQKRITAKDIRDSFQLIGSKVEAVSSGYKDYLKIANTPPTSGWAKGLYKLLEIGDYINLTPAVDNNGNPTTIKGESGKINEAYFNGSVWTKSEIQLPKSENKIDTWLPISYTSGKQVIRSQDNAIYEASQNVTSSDVPGISPLWIKKVGVNVSPTFNATSTTEAQSGEQIAKRYDKTLAVLKYFISGQDVLEKVYKASDTDKNIFGVGSDTTGQLLKNNTISPDNSAAYFSWKNIPLNSSTKKITKIELKVVRFGGNIGANLLGIKDDGAIDVLVGAMGTPSGQLDTYTFDVSSYKYVSYSYFIYASFPATNNNEIKFFSTEEKGAAAAENAVINYINNEIYKIGTTSFNCRISIEGQSNAYGYGTTNDLLTQSPFSSVSFDWLKAFSRVFIWNPNTNSYENLKLKTNNTGYFQPSEIDWFGVEIGIALTWLQTHKFGNLYIDKHCENGQAIAYFQKGSSFYTSRLLPRKSAANQWLKDRNISVNDIAFVWIQGESDMNNSQAYYLGALKKLISDRMEDKLIKVSTNIILAQVNPQNKMYSANVATAKDEYIAFNKQAKIITYPNLTWDGVHLTAAGQVDLGLQAGYSCLETDKYLIGDIDDKKNWNI